MQFVNLDSVNAIYHRVIRKDPTLLPYFTPSILMVPIALMNLVTAVVVEGALEQARNDNEVAVAYEKEWMKKLTPDLHELFKGLDDDGSGSLEKDELVNAVRPHGKRSAGRRDRERDPPAPAEWEVSNASHPSAPPTDACLVGCAGALSLAPSGDANMQEARGERGC